MKNIWKSRQNIQITTTDTQNSCGREQLRARRRQLIKTLRGPRQKRHPLIRVIRMYRSD